MNARTFFKRSARIFGFVIIALFLPNLFGEENQIKGAEHLRLLAALFEKQANILKNIDCAEYTMRRELVSGAESKRFSIEYTLLESADGRFRCSWLQTEANGNTLDQSGAFDGKIYQIVTASSSTSFVAHGLPKPSRLVLSADEFVFSPFWYVFPSPGSLNYFGGPSLELLRSPEAFTDLLKKVQSIELMKVNDVDACLVKFEPQIDRLGNEVVRQVTFRLSDGYPFMTETFNSDGFILSRYKVDELEKASTGTRDIDFMFPKCASAQYFLVPENGHRGSEPAIAAAYKYTISDCKLGEATSGEFSFDMSTVDKIYDEASDTLITVPK